MQPQPEMHGRRLSDDASLALPMPSWTHIGVVVWIRRQICYEAASRDTLGRDHAANGKRELRDSTRSVVECATSEGHERSDVVVFPDGEYQTMYIT